jgi:hypothetical protein
MVAILRHPIASGAAAFAFGAAVMLEAGLPLTWLLLAVCATISIVILVQAGRSGRLIEPLPLIALVALVSLTLRPLELLLNETALRHAARAQSGLDTLLSVRHQEIALFVSRGLADPLDQKLALALAACAAFLVAVAFGYRVPLGARLADRLERLGADRSQPNVVHAIAACLVIGASAQAIILIQVGGPVAAARGMLTQENFAPAFALFLLANFMVAGLLLWAAWAPPRTGLMRIAFLLLLLEIVLFYALMGSRGRAFVPLVLVVVVSHYLWRPWRVRELVALAVVCVVGSSAYLVLRSATGDVSARAAAGVAVRHAGDPRVFLNDNTAFDGLFQVTALVGSGLAYRYGGEIVDAIRSYVPHQLDPGKPDGSDITFRRAVWGETVEGGRPFTVLGELYMDFGFAGVVAGGFLLGVVARSLLGLVKHADTESGGEYRVALFAIALTTLYALLVGVYAVALGFAFLLLVPFLLAVHVVGRWPR